jgi:hypothetical protein
MSRPLSGKKELSKSQSKIIIIKKDRINSAKAKGSTLTVEQGAYKVQYNMGLNSQNLNKDKIDITVKNIEKSVEIYKNNKKNSKEIPDFYKLKTNSNELNEENNNMILINNENTQKAKNSEKNEKENISNKTIDDDKSIKKTNQNIKLQMYNNKNNPFKEEKNSKEEIQNPQFIIYNNSRNDSYSEEEDNQRYERCIICERKIIYNNIYSCQSKRHKICRRCVKNYYEDIIEQGERKIKCPIFYCDSPFDKSLLKNIISIHHYNLLDGKPNMISQLTSYHLKENYNSIYDEKETLKLYTKRHVLDINSNQSFFMFNKAKNQFCSKCNESSLFSKIGGHFIKCLNCFHRICKYCLKEFDEFHMDIGYEDHCKVYYRLENDNIEKNSCIYEFLIQLFFVIASFSFLFIGSFKYFKLFFQKIFCVKNYDSWYFWIFVYFFTFIFFICSIPFLLIGFPYFPIFTAIFN